MKFNNKDLLNNMSIYSIYRGINEPANVALIKNNLNKLGGNLRYR